MPTEINCIGRILSKEGAVIEMCSKTREELQRFLGMLNHLCKFIPTSNPSMEGRRMAMAS